MTDLAAALADTSMLHDFEGLPVRRAGIEIPGVAGGLRDAIRIEPQEFHKGDKVWIALEVVVQKVRFDPIDKDEPAGDQERVHIFAVEGATFVDAELVERQVKEQRDRIAKAREEAKGIQRIKYGEELQADHDQGLHASGLVEGCPDCDAELTAAAAEAEPGTEVKATSDDQGSDATVTQLPGKRGRGRAKDAPQA